MPPAQGLSAPSLPAAVELSAGAYGQLVDEHSHGASVQPVDEEKVGRRACWCCPVPKTQPSLCAHGIAYSAATLATLVKTVAWWFNQWPFMVGQPFWAKWLSGAVIAGLEYCPMTFAMGYGVGHAVSLSLMTAFMEAMDNLLRMLQQVALGKPLQWFDWAVGAALMLCVLWQGWHHYQEEGKESKEAPESAASPPNAPTPRSGPPRRAVCGGGIAAAFIATATILATCGGWTGKAYALAIAATSAKTFAWWINQYPCIRRRPFVLRWMAGWSIAAVIEYCPLVAAFTVASNHDVHLGLLTAFMEALDNVCRMCQMWLLAHPLRWYDYAAASGMVLAVAFQGVMHAAD